MKAVALIRRDKSSVTNGWRLRVKKAKQVVNRVRMTGRISIAMMAIWSQWRKLAPMKRRAVLSHPII